MGLRSHVGEQVVRARPVLSFGYETGPAPPSLHVNALALGRLRAILERRVDDYRRLCLMQILPQTCISPRSPARGKQSAHSDAEL